MFSFPHVLEARLPDRNYSFTVREVHHNVFALGHSLHEMQNEDQLTFGYLIYTEGFLMAYCVTAEEPSEQQLIFNCYLGPEEQLNWETHGEQLRAAFQGVAVAVGQFMTFQNVHPAILNKEAFQLICDGLKRGLQGLDSKVIPYIHPIKGLAQELRDFYGEMHDALERMERLNGAPALPPPTDNSTNQRSTA